MIIVSSEIRQHISLRDLGFILHGSSLCQDFKVGPTEDHTSLQFWRLVTCCYILEFILNFCCNFTGTLHSSISPTLRPGLLGHQVRGYWLSRQRFHVPGSLFHRLYAVQTPLAYKRRRFYTVKLLTNLMFYVVFYCFTLL